jgi:hypothetical protein
VVHGHCHHKSVLGFQDEQQVIEKLGLDCSILDSGCCGMAGAFGFEKGAHYDVSIACGERVLLPAVRGAGRDTLIVADGFSCREQVAQLTNRHPLHFAELLKLAIGGDGRRLRPMPENEILAQHRAAVRKSKVRAGIALGAIAAGAAVLGWAVWRRA